MEIKGITIHNSNNAFSAKENAKLIGTKGYNSYHYLVDENEVIKLNDDVIVWHTGKGYDNGNLNTISVCICKSITTNYLEAEKQAVLLIKKLLNKYGLSKNDLYFHNDWNITKWCPHRTLDIYKSKTNWIERNFNDK